MKNFTPLRDDLVSEYGLMTAAVYGVIWRYSQQKEGVCRASIETIGDKAGVSRASAKRSIKALVDDGLVTDLTPGKRNGPHHYNCPDIPPGGGSDRPTKENEVGQTDLPGGSQRTTKDSGGGSDRPTRWVTETHLGGSDRPTKKLVEETIKKPTTKLSNDNLDADGDPPDFAEILSWPISKIKKAKLEFEVSDWQALADYEIQGKSRRSLLEFFDSRINAPPAAVEAWRSVTHRYPPKEKFDEIAETVGDSEAGLSRWRQTVVDYISNGWNPANVNNQLEIFRNGGNPKDMANGQHNQSSARNSTTKTGYSAKAQSGPTGSGPRSQAGGGDPPGNEPETYLERVRKHDKKFWDLING